MRIAIYGAGSLGTILGAYLAKSGLEVELINRNHEHIEALKKNGARIKGSVDLKVPVKAFYPCEMSGLYDIIFLMTKQLHNKEVAGSLKPFLSESGIICTMQNGIPEPSIAEIIGEDRVFGAVVEWGAVLLEPGVSEITTAPGSMSFGLGSMNGEADERLDIVKEVLEKLCPVEMENNLAGVRWSKLLFNTSFGSVGAITGGTFGIIAGNRDARRLVMNIIKESINVGRASGITFAKMQGHDVAKLLYFNGPLKEWFIYSILPVIMKKHSTHKSSMLQDVEKGKPCEIDAINGVICEYGKMFGVPTPLNDKLVYIVKKIQNGELKQGIENINLFKSDIAGS
ncbi:MAG: ketopantoate reductase family protein [Clostridiaceae bacterium]